MLTIESLTSELGLKVAAGEEGAPEREIRWVHITELLDPRRGSPAGSSC